MCVRFLIFSLLFIFSDNGNAANTVSSGANDGPSCSNAEIILDRETVAVERSNANKRKQTAPKATQQPHQTNDNNAVPPAGDEFSGTIAQRILRRRNTVAVIQPTPNKRKRTPPKVQPKRNKK